MPTPGIPIISTALYVINPETAAKIVDLPQSGSVKLGIGAQPRDVGVVGYTWKKFAYLEESGQYDTNAAELHNNIAIEYIEVTDNLNPAYQYYVNSGTIEEPIYSLLDVANQLATYENTNTYPYLYAHAVPDGEEDMTLEYTPEESNSPRGYARNDASGGGFVEHVYKKISTVEVNTTGIYTVDVSARALVNTTTDTMRAENGVKIPGPLPPVITMPADITTGEGEEQVAHVIVDDEPITLTPVAVAGETGKAAEEVGENPDVRLTSAWQRFVEGDWITAEDIEDKVTVNNDGTLTISDVINAAVVGDLYRVLVTSLRNGVSTSAASARYRVTNKPVQPVVNVRDYNAGSHTFEWTARNYQTTNNNIKNVGRNAELEVGVTAEGLKTDNISYIWVKANRNDTEILQGTYAVDLPNDERYLNFISKINAALGIVDDSGETEREKDDVIAALNVIANTTVDATDGAARYETSYQPEETGVYYCVVINELNNNIAVNVSPFFIVS